MDHGGLMVGRSAIFFHRPSCAQCRTLHGGHPERWPHNNHDRGRRNGGDERKSRMLAIVAKLKAAPGKGKELAQRMVEISAKVRANEPGNHMYAVHQSSADQDVVMIYEQYTDKAALDAHRQHMKEMGVDLSGLLAGKPELEFFDTCG
jgi:quinol monooxygenase YgiN